jgi:hypothetical protein
MQLNHILRSSLLVQSIDILGDDVEDLGAMFSVA